MTTLASLCNEITIKLMEKTDYPLSIRTDSSKTVAYHIIGLEDSALQALAREHMTGSLLTGVIYRSGPSEDINYTDIHSSWILSRHPYHQCNLYDLIDRPPDVVYSQTYDHNLRCKTTPMIIRSTCNLTPKELADRLHVLLLNAMSNYLETISGRNFCYNNATVEVKRKRNEASEHVHVQRAFKTKADYGWDEPF